MAGVDRDLRAQRSGATRLQILSAAERLFAEHGLYAVSNRRISVAAGQGNNAAVGYHFGTKADLVRAIVRGHGERIERLRAAMVAAVTGSQDVRDWVACLVRSHTAHLDSLGVHSWFARFAAQVATDPVFGAIVSEEVMAAPSLEEAIAGFDRCSPDLPRDVRAEREAMVRTLMVHVCAERERALAEGTGTPRATWDEVAAGLVDAITGLWTAPVTRR
ncbi:TetR/AcrR family transcriptional regulator [Saccharopolyspora erythraea]|uniref:TetR/AcrR family transcriptional regulator n=1 Tax=Saccharopolyspora erythraea TaxID=1836 RepID=UPI001BAB84C7|nr:TetR/AcrR family transcriptional regulator [Saccharopolyspora erythraea]QUH03609.1 TetR/AcrR family transcriptional regulator [Saccharopolyspora erythraea]